MTAQQKAQERINAIDELISQLQATRDAEQAKVERANWATAGSLGHFQGQLEKVVRSWSSMHNRPAGE